MEPIAQTSAALSPALRPVANPPAAPSGPARSEPRQQATGAPLSPPDPPRPILHLQDAKLALKDAERAYFLARVAAGPALLADDPS
jgi:hypothetical protein